MGYSPDAIKNNAAKKLAGDQEVEGQRKKVTVRGNCLACVYV